MGMGMPNVTLDKERPLMCNKCADAVFCLGFVSKKKMFNKEECYWNV